jgi:hypothetical protein
MERCAWLLHDISGMVGQYSQGNEPDHHAAYLYAYAGVPYKFRLNRCSPLSLVLCKQGSLWQRLSCP